MKLKLMSIFKNMPNKRAFLEKIIRLFDQHSGDDLFNLQLIVVEPKVFAQMTCRAS